MMIELNGRKKIDFFKDLYAEAYEAYAENTDDFKKWREQYKGSNKIDGMNGMIAEDAKYVRNITFELIESQVTSYIPTPAVSPKMYSEKNERNAKSIETLLKNKRDELPFEKLNDMDERVTPVYGGSVWLIEWDESIKTHNTVGDIKISNISPEDFIGQPNIYNIDDMDYCFVKFETTREEIVRRYGVRYSATEETCSEEAGDDKTCTVYVCYYKNDEDKVCEYVWSGDVELRDIDNYYSRKREVCSICDKKRGLCECEKPKYVLRNEDYEELSKDIHLTDGTVIGAEEMKISADGSIEQKEVQRNTIDPEGRVVFDDLTGLPIPTTYKLPVMTKTRLPFYTPNVFPIVIRKNISEEKKLFGQSDCDFIRYQQQSVNKIESRIQEKILGGGVFPIIPDGATVELDNSVWKKVFKVKPQQKGLYSALDLQADISRDVAAGDRVYDQAKRILGISASFQGQYDSSALSGKAKQIQVQQSAGRLDSKRQMKNACYAEMDKIIFQYYLAYADEPRPACYRDTFGRLQNREFNRYDFLERDAVGEWYYNDQFLFSTSAAMDIEKNRESLWEQNRLNFTSGAYGDPRLDGTQLIFWQNQEAAHYPWAHDIVEQIKERIKKKQEAENNQLMGGNINE